ncbi:hypothetical protein BDU57DRAFT_159679 [Ampelomyces quisqualis]|uniref:Uncharacterized protein n=1 Tax=Ampelomyces quisqualis TaxID=50730 RepID=A0A6A5QPF6_AMPQU|nr:hypothetical protein BDU57DRAFT_159679 [Ampelomyces quisqualis]
MSPQPPSSEEATIDAHSRSALATTKLNLRYLYDPTSSQISSRRTRALLHVVRSTFLFVFWRLVRYAKYVALGSVVATVGAGALGTVVSGAGFVLAPTGIVGAVLAGSVWGVGKFVLGRVGGRVGDYGGVDEDDLGRRGRWDRREDVGVEEMPW